MTRRPIHAAWLVALVSLWMASAGNAALWRRLTSLGTLDGPSGWLFALAMFVIVWCSLTALLSFLAWPRTLKPAAAVLLLVSALACHFMLSYGVVIDPGMVTNALQTDRREAGGLLSWKMLGTVAVLGVVPLVLLLRQPVAYATTRRQLVRNALLLGAAILLFIVSVLASFQSLAAVMRNHKEVRYLVNPLASLYSFGRAAGKSWHGDDAQWVAIGTDAHLAPAGGTTRPTVLLLVLGETARSDHFGINGYERNTTPALAREQIASFRNAWACGTSTAASVPCMFSNLTREGFESRQGQYDGLLDVLQRAGLAVLWIDNQAGCKGVCGRVPNVSTTESKGSSHCTSGECLDAVMLEGLDERIAQLDPQRAKRGVVIVMHQMGSHGPAYYLRSPANGKQFMPECTTSALNDCSRQEVVNGYDNSILYTDNFLGQAIRWLKTKDSQADAAMLYVSDHGESLGENNLYLHGMPYMIAPDVQKHVPWITWASESYQRNKHLSMDCLRSAQDAPVSHDNYFHSVLGMMNVQTAAYSAGMDAYARCRGVS